MRGWLRRKNRVTLIWIIAFAAEERQYSQDFSPERPRVNTKTASTVGCSLLLPWMVNTLIDCGGLIFQDSFFAVA
jgi:hypothetical protein